MVQRGQKLSLHDVTYGQRARRLSMTPGRAEEIRELLQRGRRLSIRDIALKVGLSTSTVHWIVTRELGMLRFVLTG